MDVETARRCVPPAQGTRRRKPPVGKWPRLIASPIALGGAIVLLTATMAPAAEGGGKGGSEFLLLIQVALLIGVGRGLGELMQRIGQPSVIGELLAGLILGPSLFGWLWPSAQAAIFPRDPVQKAML